MNRKNIYLTSPKRVDGTIAIPMIEFEIVASHIEFGDRDTLIFTSKQAVASADEIDSRWKEIPSVAIGPATEKEIKKRGGIVLYRPDKFYGEILSKDIREKFADRKLLYLRPEKVSFDMKSYLENAGIDIKEQIIYKTSCKRYSKNDTPKADSIIVFTSPSTIFCFLKNFSWRDDYTAVVIGKATLEHLPKNAKYLLAKEPTIDSCIEKAKRAVAN